MNAIGIDALSYYIPGLYLPIESLAQARDIPYAKLYNGLGLENMALPDANEDAASFAANALLTLIEDYKIDPREIGRIYVGTESAVDGSKPTATYALEYVEQHLESSFGARCFKNCDCVDLTFACIGAVDAMQNCMDWVRGQANRKAIVIATDLSKYELYSTGEYTQGAGAVAVLLSQNPALLRIDDVWGIGMASVGDFFKPRRIFNKQEILQEAVNSSAQLAPTGPFWESQDQTVSIYKEEPVFDGQYSNACYSDRITEAMAHYKNQTQSDLLQESDYLIFHLPYAYHGRRIIVKNWLESIKNTAVFVALEQEIGLKTDDKEWLRKVAKSDIYKGFVDQKIAITELGSTQIGNMYTASIFMALTSLLWYGKQDGLTNEQAALGFLAYGSGSKAKVFKGQLQANWQSQLKGKPLYEAFQKRQKVTVQQYEDLHRGKQVSPVSRDSKRIVLKSIEHKNETSLGLRSYGLF